MSAPLPDGIDVIDLPDGVRYRLPRRDVGGLRFLEIGRASCRERVYVLG